MYLIYAAIIFVVGMISGALIARFMIPDYKKNAELQKKLTLATYQSEQRDQELTDHFINTAQVLESLGKEYNNLYKLMVDSSAELLNAESAKRNPFSHKKKLSAKINLADNISQDAYPTHLGKEAESDTHLAPSSMDEQDDAVVPPPADYAKTTEKS